MRIAKGDSGASVREIQGLLGLKKDGEFDAEINDFARTADFQCYKAEPDY